jgi:hypothetical protein
MSIVVFGFFFINPLYCLYLFYWFSLKIVLGLVLVDCYLSKNEKNKIKTKIDVWLVFVGCCIGKFDAS